MNSFLDRMHEKRDYLLRKGNLNHVSYGIFRLWGTLRAVTARLPITTIEKMKLLEEKCPDAWESRQEMLFEMIESCIQDWIAKQPLPEQVEVEFDQAARKALKKGLGRDFPSDTREEI